MHGLDAVGGEIIFLKFIEGKSSEEISRLLWISQEAVRQRVSRALRRLKELLED
jgi:RNA polymerase sigma factor (sigma-70 family)